MARTLDSKYFSLLRRRVEGPYEYQSYQTVCPTATMVLFSKSDPTMPIAGLSFLPRVRGGNAKTVVSRRATDALPVGTAAALGNKDEYAYFHGFTNVDNEEFAFAIHNLTDFVRNPNIELAHGSKNDMGFLKIDILGHKHKVLEVDMPTIGVNQVNELKPSQSYLVQSDQRTGNKTMVLRGEIDEKTGQRLTVEKDEATASGQLNDKTKGTYFFVNVVASAAFPAMVALLADSTWRAVDVFTRRIPKDNGVDTWTRFGAVQELSMVEDYDDSDDGGLDDIVTRASYHMGDRSRGAIGGNNRNSGNDSRDRDRGDRDRGAVRTFAVTNSSSRGAQSASRSVRSLAMSDDYGYEECAARPVAKGRSYAAQQSVAATPTSTEQKSAQAGKVVQGSQSITVNSGWTGLTYAYETPGERVCLGLGIWRDMRTMEQLTGKEALDEASMQLQDAIANQGKALLDSLKRVYKQDTCSVCLTNEPSVVFFQCGHSCLCEECLRDIDAGGARGEKRCYLCRAPIAARIAASALSAATGGNAVPV